MNFRDRTFMVEGVPITFYEIEMWYTEALRENKNKAIAIGDPYKSRDACEIIAKLIYNEMLQKINKSFGINIQEENEKFRKEQEKDKKERERRDKIFNDLYSRTNPFSNQEEDRWSSTEKFIEIMNFAKQKAYEQQYGKQSQNVKEIEKETKSWKEILHIPNDREITERTIKVCFRKLARKYHPDLQSGNEKKMKELIEARNQAFKEIRRM